MLCTFSISNCEKDSLPFLSKPSRSFKGGFRDSLSHIYLGLFCSEIMATVSRLGTSNRHVTLYLDSLGHFKTIEQFFRCFRQLRRICDATNIRFLLNFPFWPQLWKRWFSPKICISIERINLQCLKCHRQCASKLLFHNLRASEISKQFCWK